MSYVSKSFKNVGDFPEIHWESNTLSPSPKLTEKFGAQNSPKKKKKLAGAQKPQVTRGNQNQLRLSFSHTMALILPKMNSEIVTDFGCDETRIKY